MAKEMTWNEFVSEYKPIEFNEDIVVLNFLNFDIRKYLIRYPGNDVYPDPHISIVCINESHWPDSAGRFFLYIVTRKPMVNIDKIIIELDAKNKISIFGKATYQI